MSVTFRPAIRQNTPLIIGIAGPTKSGKTFSALRLATGLVDPGATIVMVNAEGPRGHAYADKFKYLACDLTSPYRPKRYTEAVHEATKLTPGCLIIDSVSHMHDGPGGILEYHEDELDRIAGQDMKARQRATFTAWVRPKADENEFIYALLGLGFPVILCMRAKEKLRIVKGKDPEDLGWQPIVSDRVAFETIFTVMLPPHSKGVPDLSISDMREPFDTMIPPDKPIDEDLGRQLAVWARGGSVPPPTAKHAAQPTSKPMPKPANEPSTDRASLMAQIKSEADKRKLPARKRVDLWQEHIGAGGLDNADVAALHDLLNAIKTLNGR